jgi:hypothetical protein
MGNFYNPITTTVNDEVETDMFSAVTAGYSVTVTIARSARLRNSSPNSALNLAPFGGVFILTRPSLPCLVHSLMKIPDRWASAAICMPVM